MPLKLKGSCRCGAVHFTRAEPHAPRLISAAVARSAARRRAAGGYAINLGADNGTLAFDDPDKVIGVFRAEIRQDDGACERSTGERSFCTRCGTALWLYDPSWADLIHPFASVVDSELPKPPVTTHLMLDFKPSWVEFQRGPDDLVFNRYPDQSIEDWHRAHGLWVD